MRIIKTQKNLRHWIQKTQKKQVGFVATMGALHKGHLSLVKASVRENDLTVASIFVNPLQFGPKEDFNRYPRTFADDRKQLEAAKVDVLFFPLKSEMYPAGYSTRVQVGKDQKDPLVHSLCGQFRPGHFEGVATVVAKLFHVVEPDRAYFGLKDYQQCQVIKRMILDLNMPIDVRTLPIVRESDGLALSSRNRYLSIEERQRAATIAKELRAVRHKLKSSRDGLSKIKSQARASLRKKVDRIEYLDIVDPVSLEPLKRRAPKMVVLAACYVGKTRLIDNVIIP